MATTSYLVPPMIIYLVIFMILILMSALAWLVYIIYRKRRLDRIILIDKNNRWKLHYDKIFGKKEITINKKKYFLVEECGLVNQKGKVLYIFSENQPTPLKIEYNNLKWLDAETINSYLNNDLIQLMLKSTSKPDLLILMGAIGGMIAGGSSVLILLIQLGVLGT